MSGAGFDSGIARRAPGSLVPFNDAGVLCAADVHVAHTLLSLGGVDDADPDQHALALGTALAVRAPRLGHVFVDLARVAATVTAEYAESAPDAAAAQLRWPEAIDWPATFERHAALVASGESGTEELTPGGPLRPLRLIGSRLYLDRYWRQERSLAAMLLALDTQPLRNLELPRLAELLAALFPDGGHAEQRAAAASAALRGLTVVAGGPGTGKTTTVARTVALLQEIAATTDTAPPLIALCAPTGKAAARLAEAIAAEATTLPVSAGTRAALAAANASTIHRLLGARGEGRFAHNATNPLPHDVVVVDETSMVSLSLISRLLAAVRRDARLVLVGDPDQLSAIEAGAVLRDIVGPAAEGPRFGEGMRGILTQTTGTDPREDVAVSGVAPGAFGDGVVVLRRGHRFGAPIAALADAIRRGDGDAAVAAAGASDQITWIQADAADLNGPRGAGAETPAVVLRELILARFGTLITAARAGRSDDALTALATLRVLCAHRHGPYGVRNWTLVVEEWLTNSLGFPCEGDYPGRPLLVTENDYELGLYNGDSGVILAGPDGPLATFEREGGPLALAPARLASVETAYATTIHKSQGSQFDTAVVILPDAESRLLSRELLYTAVTRAQRHLVIVGAEATLLAATARPVQRATGLEQRLWGGG